MASAGLALYRGGTVLLSPFALAFLVMRARAGKEDRAGFGERLGQPTIARPRGKLVWLHGASIGEGLALLPLIAALRQRGFAVLLTTGTRSSAQVLDGRLPDGALHQLAPLDFPNAVARFLGHWQPDMLVLAESELWPNILLGCKTREIPVVVVNGRLSEKSHTRWRRAPEAARQLFATPECVLAQTDTDAARFADLGARDVRVAGNLKHDRAPPPVDAEELARWRAALGTRPVLAAASTHATDEPVILRAIERLRETHRDLLTVIVPRDISRAPAIAAEMQKAGHVCAMRSHSDAITAQTDMLVADTVGEMGLWLRLASIAIIGKTFDVGGGQTPIEAAQCGAAIVYGPSVDAFADVFAALDVSGGALCVHESSALADAVDRLLSNPAHRRKMARAATTTVDNLRGATVRTLDVLLPLLAPVKDVAA